MGQLLGTVWILIFSLPPVSVPQEIVRWNSLQTFPVVSDWQIMDSVSMTHVASAILMQKGATFWWQQTNFTYPDSAIQMQHNFKELPIHEPFQN